MTWKTGLGIAALAIATTAVAQDTSVRYDTDRTYVAERSDGNWRNYKANELNFSFFGTGTVGEDVVRRPSVNRIDRSGQLGAGVGVQYFFHRMVGISADAYSESTSDHFIDNVNADLIVRFPLADSGVALYGLAGGGRMIDPLYQWTVNAGGGLEWRFSDHVGIFIDARYVWADETKDFGLGRAGLRVGF